MEDKKIIRGKLLAFLRYVHPETAEESAIVGTYYQYHEPDTLLRELEYLVDKGYVTRTEKPHPYRERRRVRLYKIAPLGIDLQDGTTEDPGVTVVD